jgi:hypothetical protein
MLATGPVLVFLDGVEIGLSALGGNLYAGDISSFAGTTAELKIANAAPVGQVHDYSVVDDISFSSIPVPEPSSMSFWIFGAASILAWRKNRAIRYMRCRQARKTRSALVLKPWGRGRERAAAC